MSPSPPLPRKAPVGLKNLGKNLLLILLSLTAALALMEMTLRFYNPLGFRIKGDKIVLPVNKNEIRPHPQAKKLDPLVTVHRNSLGFRGAEPPPDLSRQLSLITVGGSTTECRELADDRTWTFLLGDKLARDFQPLWINNAGLSGHSTFGHTVLMQDYIIRIKPRVVVFLIGMNEMGREDAIGVDRNLEKGLTLKSFRSLERFLAALADRSEAAAALLNLKRYFFPKVERAITYNEVDLKALPTLEMSAEARASMQKLHEDRYLGPYQARLANLVRLAQEHHLTPVLMTQPALFGRATDELTGVDLGKIKATTTMNGEVAWEILELYNDVTRQVGQAAGVLVIDAARELPKSSRYYYDLAHYTNAGAGKLAEITYAGLKPFLAQNYPEYRAGGFPRTPSGAGPEAGLKPGSTN
jgi:hypothetical protein